MLSQAIIDQITINTSGFLFGIMLGVVITAPIAFLLGRASVNKFKNIKATQINVVIWSVIFLWVSSTLYDLISVSYQTPFPLNVFFGLVAGFLLDYDVLKFLKR